MNAWMNGWMTALGYGLADYWVASALILGLVVGVLARLQQPIQRQAVARITLLALLLLAFICAIPGWPRHGWISRTAGLDRVVATGDAVRAARYDAGAAGGSSERAASAGGSRDEAQSQPPASAADSPAMSSFSWSIPLVGRSLGQSVSGWSILAGVHMALAALVVLWLGRGSLKLLFLCRDADPAPAWLDRLLVQVAGQSEPRPRPRLLLSRRIVNPIATGIVRPTIVLPWRLVEEGVPESLSAALAHEWAHIRQKDLWAATLARCLLPLLALHPLYWWLRCRMRDDQEIVADAAAAGATGRVRYAEELLQWARRLLESPSAPIASVLQIGESVSQLSRRIAVLLDENVRVETSCSYRWRRRWLGILGALALGLSLVTLRPQSPALAQPEVSDFPSEFPEPQRHDDVPPASLGSAAPAGAPPSRFRGRIDSVPNTEFVNYQQGRESDRDTPIKKREPLSASVLEIVRSYDQTQAKLRSFAVVFEQVETTKGTIDGERQDNTSHAIRELRTDGKRFKYLRREWGYLNRQVQDWPKEKAVYNSFMFDGRRLFQYGENMIPGRPHRLFLTLNPDPKYVEREHQGVLNQGYLRFSFGYEVAVPPLEVQLQEADRVSVRKDPEKVGDSECRVLEVVMGKDRHTLWFDPAHDYHLAKARGVRHEKLRNGDENLARVARDVSRFEKFQEVWVPMEVERSLEVEGKDNYAVKVHIQCTSFRLAPDHDALRSFRPDDVTNGSIVEIIGRDGVRYRWQDGKLIPERGADQVLELK